MAYKEIEIGDYVCAVNVPDEINSDTPIHMLFPGSRGFKEDQGRDTYASYTVMNRYFKKRDFEAKIKKVTNSAINTISLASASNSLADKNIEPSFDETTKETLFIAPIYKKTYENDQIVLKKVVHKGESEVVADNISSYLDILNILDENGEKILGHDINTNNTTFSGFSYRGEISVKASVEFLKEKQKNGIKMQPMNVLTIDNEDPVTLSSYEDGDAEILKENKATVFSICGQSGKTHNLKGIRTIRVSLPTTSHDEAYNTVFEQNFIDFLSGRAELRDKNRLTFTEYVDGKKQKITYEELIESLPVGNPIRRLRHPEEFSDFNDGEYNDNVNKLLSLRSSDKVIVETSSILGYIKAYRILLNDLKETIESMKKFGSIARLNINFGKLEKYEDLSNEIEKLISILNGLKESLENIT